MAILLPADLLPLTAPSLPVLGTLGASDEHEQSPDPRVPAGQGNKGYIRAGAALDMPGDR